MRRIYEDINSDTQFNHIMNNFEDFNAQLSWTTLVFHSFSNKIDSLKGLKYMKMFDSHGHGNEVA